MEPFGCDEEDFWWFADELRALADEFVRDRLVRAGLIPPDWVVDGGDLRVLRRFT